MLICVAAPGDWKFYTNRQRPLKGRQTSYVRNTLLLRNKEISRQGLYRSPDGRLARDKVLGDNGIGLDRMSWWAARRLRGATREVVCIEWSNSVPRQLRGIQQQLGPSTTWTKPEQARSNVSATIAESFVNGESSAGTRAQERFGHPAALSKKSSDSP